MSDLVKRLRDWSDGPETSALCDSAADRIEQLERVLAQARGALEWSIDQGGGPICEHDSGGAACFCKENDALSAINEALHSEFTEVSGKR